MFNLVCTGEEVAGRLSLRVQQLNVSVETKTKASHTVFLFGGGGHRGVISSSSRDVCCFSGTGICISTQLVQALGGSSECTILLTPAAACTLSSHPSTDPWWGLHVCGDDT